MSSLLHLHQQFCQHALVFKNNSPRSVKSFHYSFVDFTKKMDLNNIEQVGKAQIEQFLIDGKLYRNWSAKTIRNHLQYLSLFLDWCVEQNHISSNPSKSIKKPKLPKRIPKSLNKEQAIKLIDWAENYPYSYSFERSRAAAIIAMFIFTGIRLKELYNLKMINVDLVASTLTIRAGKGNKDRMIPLNARLVIVLKKYIRQREKYNKTCPHFFASLKHNEKMGDSAVRRLVDKLRKASQIEFYPHLLRHTFATLMLEGGCDIYSLSKMMGHADIQTTTIYLSTSNNHLQQQIHKHPLYW